jgi:hypothetical protein
MSIARICILVTPCASDDLQQQEAQGALPSKQALGLLREQGMALPDKLPGSWTNNPVKTGDDYDIVGANGERNLWGLDRA